MKTTLLTVLHISAVFCFHWGAVLAEDRYLIGLVTDLEGNPIPYVDVTIPRGDLQTTTDKDGRFMMETREDETMLVFHHSAFESERTTTRGSDKGPIEIQLTPKVYHFDPVIVEGNLYAKDRLRLPVSHQLIPVGEASTWGNSVSDVLDRRGLRTQDYGGAAGLKTIASSTANSTHILVMLESLPLNSPQNGGIDLSTLPVELFKQGEFYWGHGSSLYGSNAMGGTLNLITDKHQSSYLHAKAGSYGERGVGGKMAINFGPFRGSVYGNQYENRGDFRDNNDFAQESYSAQLSLPLGKMWKASAFSIWSVTDRGVSGSTDYPSLNATKSNDEQIHVFTLRGLSPWGRTAIDAGFTGSHEHFRNPDWMIDSEHQVNTWRLRATHRFALAKSVQNTAILEVSEDRVNSDDAGNHEESLIATGLLTEVSLLRNLQIWPGIRTELSQSRDTRVTTWSLGLSWRTDFNILESVSANLGTSYRNPTFNDLYWVPGGNPNLDPERGTSANFSLHLSPFPSRMVNMEARGYHVFTRDLIQWAPDEKGMWSPRNIAKSESYGVSLTVDIAPQNLPFRLSLTTDQNKSHDLSDLESKGKRLIYVPAVSHWAEIRFRRRIMDLNLSYRFLGKRTYNYYEKSMLPSYQRLDLSITFRGPKISAVSPSLDFGIRNLLDRKQESVQGYPEPGRTLFAKLSFEIP